MPEISRFYGIIIKMFFGDHFPPHFHAYYNDFEAFYSIETGEIFHGEMPKPQHRLDQAWVELHREELNNNWNILTAESQVENFFKIKPLD